MSVNKYNREGYYDPTAYEALTIIDREISQSRYNRPRRYMQCHQLKIFDFVEIFGKHVFSCVKSYD